MSEEKTDRNKDLFSDRDNDNASREGGSKKESPAEENESSSSKDESKDKRSDSDNSGQIEKPKREFSSGLISRKLKPMQVDQGSDRYLFSALLVLGFIAIIIAKSALDAPAILVTGLACLAIIGYGVFALVANRTNYIRMDRAGDNCYYLGLAFTLASLIASLLILNDEVGTRLLGNFGVALGSTAAGIIMRLLLMQFRTEIDDFESQTRFKLSEASDNYRKQLQTASGDIETFQRSVLGSIESAQEDIQSALKAHAKEMREASKVSLSTIEKRIKTAEGQIEAFDEKFAALSKYTDALSLAAGSLNEKLSQFASHPEHVARTTEAVDTQIRHITKSYDESISTLNESLSLLTKTVSEHTAELGSASSSLKNYIEQLDSGSERLTTSSENAQRANAEAIDALASLAKTLRENLKNG